jgi:uncharacterized protein
MKRILTIVPFLVFAVVTKAQHKNNIVIGKTDTIFSNVLHEQRKILVYTPNLTATTSLPNQRYPVLYVLDGEAHFVSTVGLVQQLSQANGNAVIPEMIIVGITNTNRFRDLTPSATGNNFIQFLQTELLPYIDLNYPTAPYKVLVGHSLGGLTAIDMLTKNLPLFNAYIAIDPSIWFEKERFLQNAIAHLPANRMKHKKLFIGTANTMPAGMTVAKLKKDTSKETQHIRSIFKLDHFLKTTKVSGLQYAHKYYENETHVSVPLISEYDGLRFIFNYYLIDISEKDFKDTTLRIADKYKAHYEKVSKEMGYKVVPPEAFINYIAFDALEKNQYKKSEALLKMNIQNHPNNATVYNIYADFLLLQKDTNTAIDFYKIALSMKDDAAIQYKLNSILPKPTSQPGQDSGSVSQTTLEQYVGNYMIEQYKIPVVIKLQSGALWAITPGQKDSELVPVSKNIFGIKNKPGYTLTFHLEGDRVRSFTSAQPNGIFEIIKQ